MERRGAGALEVTAMDMKARWEGGREGEKERKGGRKREREAERRSVGGKS